MRNFALVSLFSLLCLSASAQVFVQNTMYSYNRFIYNPAAAGIQQSGMGDLSGLNVTLLGRLQWVGIDGGPNLSTVSVHAPVDGIGAIGGYIIADQLGPFTTTGGNVAYAFQKEFGTGNMISIGVNGGFLQKSINANFVPPEGVPDPLVGIGNYSATTFVPNLGAGIYLEALQRKLFVGLSGQDLLEPSIEGLFIDNVGDESRVPRSFYFSAGYAIDIANEMILEPMVFARTDLRGIPQIDMSLYWRYKVMTAGVSYRLKDSFSGIVGFNVLDRTFLGYSFDYTTSPLNANGDLSSHEIIISYTFPGSGGSLKKHDNPRDDNKTGLGL